MTTLTSHTMHHNLTEHSDDPAVHPIGELLYTKAECNTPIKIQGWVRTRRDSKAGMSFLDVNDGSCLAPMQVVIPNTLQNYTSEVLRLTTGCSVSIEGLLVASPAKEQSVELQANKVEVLGWVDDPDSYPMSPKRHTLEYLREHAHLRPRTNIIGAVTRVQHTLAYAIHRFFHERGFYWIHTPIITGSDCEGAGEMFRVSTLDLSNLPRTQSGQIDFSQDFFGKETFLTVSGQLNVEGYCLAMSKVYTFGPTFRAENSNTSRHLAEFWMVEPEIAFADLNDDADLAESMLKDLCQTVFENCSDDMAFFAKWVDPDCVTRLSHIIDSPFERMEYTAVIQLLQKSGKNFEYPPVWGKELQTEHERYLCEQIVGRPVIVMNYPKEAKAFYMRLNDDQKTVAAMDVLAPSMGEIIGGSQREERLSVLDARIAEMGLPIEHYDWYRDLRRYGTVPHAGFGLGFERLIAYVTGVTNIRDVIPFPRTVKHAGF